MSVIAPKFKLSEFIKSILDDAVLGIVDGSLIGLPCNHDGIILSLKCL